MGPPSPGAEYPRRFGRFTLLEKIGEGGMAEAFLAQLEPPGTRGSPLVIKRIHRSLANEPRLSQMLVNEATLAARLIHPSIVRVFELGNIGGELYIAMEYIPGLDLAELLARAEARGIRLPIWFTLHLMAEIAGALAHAHAQLDEAGKPRPIIHRDVSPNNIFVSRDGAVKLADFGVAKAISELTPKRPEDTQGGHLKGKLGYMPPEQIHGDALEPASDVFSAGVVLWECLTQRRLFSGRADFEVMLAVCEEARPAPSRFNPAVPVRLDALVLTTLEPDRHRRLESAKSLELELRSISAQVRPAPAPAELAAIVGQLMGRASAAAGAAQELKPATPTDFLKPGRRPSSSQGGSRDLRPALVAETLTHDLEIPSAATPPSLPLKAPPVPPFFLRSGTRVAGPMSYPELVVAADTGAKAGAEVAVSADGVRFLPLEDFARLMGLDYFTPGDPPVLNATVVDAIEKRSLTAVLSSLALRRATGRFVIRSGPLRREIEVLHGAPTHVYTDRADLQIPALLARREVIPSERLAEFVHAALSTGQSLEEVLRIRLGLILALHRPRLMRDRLTEIFRWRQGRYSFEEGRPLTHTAPFAASLLAPLPELVQRCFDAGELAALIRPQAAVPLVSAPCFEEVTLALELPKPQQAAAERLATQETFETLAAEGADPHRLSVLLYLLTESGALVPASRARSG